MRPRPVAGNLALTREGDAWRVRSTRLERLVIMSDLESGDAVRLLLRHVERSGLPQALRRAGAAPGDMVRVGELALRWPGIHQRLVLQGKPA